MPKANNIVFYFELMQLILLYRVLCLCFACLLGIPQQAVEGFDRTVLNGAKDRSSIFSALQFHQWTDYLISDKTKNAIP